MPVSENRAVASGQGAPHQRRHEAGGGKEGEIGRGGVWEKKRFSNSIDSSLIEKRGQEPNWLTRQFVGGMLMAGRSRRYLSSIT